MTVISRRCFIKGFTVFGSCFFLGSKLEKVIAADDELTAERLKLDLRASTKKEEAYIDDICQQRTKGKIPARLIYSSWKYAMKKNSAARLIFFNKCLQILCSRAKITISFLKF